MRVNSDLNMVILGISGKRGVGKTLLASHLVRTCGFTKVSFAEDLKKMAKNIFPFSDADLSTPSLKERKFKTYDWSPRDFLINLGEFVRYHDPEYFLRQALAKCENKDGFYVFDDMRYENEYNVIKNIGGKVIRVNRDEKQNPYGKNLDTISETALDKFEFDYVIEKFRNNTPKELTNHTESILSMWE